jgi:hypothetical protein
MSAKWVRNWLGNGYEEREILARELALEFWRRNDLFLIKGRCEESLCKRKTCLIFGVFCEPFYRARQNTSKVNSITIMVREIEYKSLPIFRQYCQ